MKKISTLLAIILVSVISNAQTVYNVTSNKNYKNNYPATCNNCTFNIAAGVLLVINTNVTLKNATFNGGAVSVSANSITLNSNSKFNNTEFVLNSGSNISASTSMLLNNTDFIFKGTSRLTTQYPIELDNSRLNFYGDSYLQSIGSTINLKNNSLIVAGDGSLSSDAYLFLLGTQLTLNDNAAVIIANSSNYYFNLASYYSTTTNQSFSTLFNAYNCGSAYPNRCSMGTVYGPVNLLPTGVSSGNMLPVVLSDFAVRRWNTQTQLTWVTDQESNSARFEVERSTDGTNWTTIARIAAKGNSTIQSKYACVDKWPAPGINYYRLKMVDLDNTYDLSEVKSVRAADVTSVRVFPNPARSNVNISLPSSATAVRLLNTAGRILQERKTVSGNSTLSFDVSNYTAGTYMVQVINTDGTSCSSVLLIAK